MKIKEMSIENRPLERLLLGGAETLSQAELLALVIKTGTKENNVLNICQEVFSKHPLKDIGNVSITELQKIKGIGKIKACQIKAVFEISKRILSQEIRTLKSPEEKTKIVCPTDVYNLLFPVFFGVTHEKLVAVFLSNRNDVIDYKVITTGTSNQTLISSKDIVLEAMRRGADGIIIVHNHPSGICEPSIDDKQATEMLKKAAKLMDIQLIDHVIISEKETFSFREKGLI